MALRLIIQKEKRRNGKVTRKHLSRYVIYFLCTIYLSRPILHASSFIPSTPFAICFFNGLLLATNVRVIAVSIYMRVYVQHNLLTNCITSCAFFVLSSSDNRNARPYPFALVPLARFSIARKI